MCVIAEVTFFHSQTLLCTSKTSSWFVPILLGLVAVDQLSEKLTHKSIKQNVIGVEWPGMCYLKESVSRY